MGEFKEGIVCLDWVLLGGKRNVTTVEDLHPIFPGGWKSMMGVGVGPVSCQEKSQGHLC